MSGGWRRALRWATALALIVVAGFYWFDNFTLVSWGAYDVFPDLVAWTMIVTVIATALTSRLARAWRWAGVGLWLAATVSLTVTGIVRQYVRNIGEGDIGYSIGLWASNGYDMPVPLPILIVIALVFAAAVSGPPARSATIDAIFFWPPEPLDRQSGDSGARL